VLDGWVLADAGDLAEQVDVHAEPAAAVRGPGGAAFGHRHVEAYAGERDRGREPD
jgi:hypothetical protein